MRRSTHSGQLVRSCGIPLLAAYLVFLFLATANAQKSQPKTASIPKYDLHTEAKIDVTVVELRLPPKGSEKDAAHLLVKSGTDSVDIY